MLNPVMANMKNLSTGRFHPVLFDENPLPGTDSPDKPVRYKSKGHHTTGFDSEGDALLHMQGKAIDAGCRLYRKKTFEWSGDGIPAMVEFFSHDELVKP